LASICPLLHVHQRKRAALLLQAARFESVYRDVPFL